MKTLTKEKILHNICNGHNRYWTTEIFKAMDQYSDQTHQVDVEFIKWLQKNCWPDKKGWILFSTDDTEIEKEFKTSQSAFDYWQKHIVNNRDKSKNK